MKRQDTVGQGRPHAGLTGAARWRERDHDHVLLRRAGPTRTFSWPHTIVRNEGDVVLMYMPKGSEITRARTASRDGRRTSHSMSVRTERGFDLTDVVLDDRVLQKDEADFRMPVDAGVYSASEASEVCRVYDQSERAAAPRRFPFDGSPVDMVVAIPATMSAIGPTCWCRASTAGRSGSGLQRASDWEDAQRGCDR